MSTSIARKFFPLARALLLVAALAGGGCKQHPAPPSPAAAPAKPKPLSLMAQIGKRLFFEPALSASGKQSCASCHDPGHAFGPANDLAVQFGGPNLGLQGIRAVPKLTYLHGTPGFVIAPDDESGGASPVLTAAPLARVAPTVAKGGTSGTTALVPRGGLFWDGRASNLQGQALGPLLNPLEMGNTSEAEIVDKLRRLDVVEQFKLLAGPNVATDSRLLLSQALFAIGRYEFEDRAFAPYDSKYDLYVAGKLALSDAEMRGLKLFDDPKKGNCAACHLDHPDRKGANPLHAQFTDYQYEALGVPRNPEIKANADPAFYDLGICGPSRTDIYSKQDANCGLFKTPSLRNVATRHAFFHNGVYHNLKDVLRFYAERDLHPEKFYPRKADGSVDVYNDLPPRYRANLDTIDAPFDRKPGQQPALDEAEMDDIIAFLGTLTDGYKPGAEAGGAP